MLLPMVAMTAMATPKFKCDLSEVGNTCCRQSVEFGLSPCSEDGPASRNLLFTFEIPAMHTSVPILDGISGKYGVLDLDHVVNMSALRVS